MVGIPSGLALQKAMLIVVDGIGVPMSLRFQYNPTEYTISKSAQWTRPETSGSESTTNPQYSTSLPATVQMEAFFDAFEEPAGDVSKDVETLLQWTRPTPPSIAKGKPQPPLLAFQWGVSQVLTDFRGFLKSVNARYTMFRTDGTPIRATANITLEEVPLDVRRQNPTSGSLLGRSSHLLREGETLHSIAHAEYGQAAYWRGLAAFNDVEDPLRLQPGSTLLIPSASEAARLSEVSADA